jgi:CPA2 family monovalent cation:H+ antiporter-2
MPHLPLLIRDLALILTAASIFAITFRFLKLPLVLGYITAGILLGPSITWMPTIVDFHNISILGELGVIFLLFSLGLEFNFKKLWSMSGPASLIGILEVMLMGLLGFGLGRWVGWSYIDSLFLGGILSISSTTIIIKTFEELRLGAKRFAQTVYAVLIVEDVFAIFILLFLSAFAINQGLSISSLGSSALAFITIAVVWLVGGLWVAKPLLNWFKKYMNEEVLLIFSVGLCLLAVLGITSMGYSAALAAFLAGTFLAETRQREKIKNLVKPVSYLFGAIFFVSVGTLINITAVQQNLGLIGLISALTVTGKILSCGVAAKLTGKSLSDSLMIGFSLGQIGEFSFIIASLGLTLKVINPVIYPITVSVAFVTTLLTPFLIRGAAQWVKKLEKFNSTKSA